jgi:hypothetical protein
MALDADDLVSRQLVEFVLRNPNPNGFIAKHGYILDEESRAMILLPDADIFELPFDQIAGCAVLRLNERDLSFTDENYRHSRFARYIGLADHRTLWEMSLKENRPLVPFPFPAYVYVLNTGENHSFIYGKGKKWRKEQLIPSLRNKAQPAKEELLDEFGLRHPVWEKSDTKRIQFTEQKDDGFRVDFIGCGSQKSGTTSLSYYLGLHPCIGLGIRKELHFFNDYKFFSGPRPNYSFYHNQFIKQKKSRIYGEIHSAYMYEPNSRERIFRYNSKIKILGILRNPIERSFSHWNMQVRDGHESLSFFDALRQEGQRDRGLAPWHNWKFSYIARGYYTEQIRRIWRMFPPEQTMFIKSEDLRNDPEGTMTKVFVFLGMDPIPLSYTINYNEGGYEGTPSAEERAFLLSTFEFEIRCLERMLGWDCSSWLT